MRMSRLALAAGLMLSCTAVSAQSILGIGKWGPAYAVGSYKEISCNDEEGNSYEIIDISVNMHSSDVGKPGMLYVAGQARSGTSILNFSESPTAAEQRAQEFAEKQSNRWGFHSRHRDSSGIYRPYAEQLWTPYIGGIPDPTVAYVSLPKGETFRLYRGSCGGPKFCDSLDNLYGITDIDFGGAYGAIQPEAQERIEQITNLPFPLEHLTLEHLMAAYSYQDGLENERFNIALSFRCDSHDFPTQYRNYYGWE